jgi:hypothetical protein
MTATFSQAAEMILSRHKQFRERLLKAIEGTVAGQCFIDGRIGRSPTNDELVLMCQGHQPINVEYSEFADEATIKRIIQEWSGPG